MSHGRSLPLLTRLLGLTLACVLATVGWAKDVPSPVADLRLAAFVAAGGEAADLCGGGPRQTHDHERCGFCPAGMSGAMPAALVAKSAQRMAVLPSRSIARLDLPLGPARHPAWSGRAPPLG